MFRFEKSAGGMVKDNSLVAIRKKAISYLKRVQLKNTVDIYSDVRGYVGNVHRSKYGVFVWSPSDHGETPDSRDRLYCGKHQGFLNADGTVDKPTDGIYEVWGVER